MQTYNSNGYLTSYLGSSSSNSGLLDLNNELGVKVSSMGAIHNNKRYNGDGGIMLFNKNGEYGWSRYGKIE